MCDKLQTSKDGSVDLCHGQLAGYSQQQSIQQYGRNSNSNVYSSSNKKQRKNYSKDKSRTDSDQSGPFGGRSHRDRHFRAGGGVVSQGQRWSKQGRPEGKKGKGPSGTLVPKDGGGVDGGKKKVSSTSLNHLLNFTITPSERRYSGGRGGVLPPVVKHRKRFHTSHSYNKEEFLQANCQFVVSASGDYSIHFEDPDKLVEWECIQQVRLFCHEIPSCPICLYPPRAAKITRCGHVYCWSCLLHYLSLGEKKWSKCPICNESIYRQDIKSVAALSSPQYKVGDTISMKLMIREKGTTQVFAKADWDDKDYPMLTIEDSCVNQFVKLVSATPSQVLSLITGPERSALESQLTELTKEDASERCFIQAALEDLKAREVELTQKEAIQSEVKKMITGHSISGSLDEAQSEPSHQPATGWTAFSDQYFEGCGFEDPFLEVAESSSDSSQSVEEEGEREGEVVVGTQALSGSAVVGSEVPEKSSEETSPETSPSSMSSRSCTSDGSSGGDAVVSTQNSKGDFIYFFYQVSDGQHFYMHPVNIKCLAKEYGGLEHCPAEITATVLEIEQLTMSEELRGRYKSLSHLPLTCELALCELELKSPLLSKDTLEHFSAEIHWRRQKRVKKKKDERRREKRAEARNSQPEPTFRVPSALELTPEKFHDFLSLASSPSLFDSGSPGPSGKSEPVPELKVEGMDQGCAPTVGSPPAPSFAQALQSKSPAWPVRVTPKGSQTDKTSTSQHRDGTTTPTSWTDTTEVSVPSFQEAFNEAFQTASESVLAAQKASGGKPGNKTAKKGRKKLVLFSTGGSRGGI